MSDIFFVSDTHFDHSRIIQYSSRPYSDVSEMNEALISNWNALVQQKDIVWHLGDFSFGNFDKIKVVLSRLNGHINLCLGNHDQEIIKHKAALLQDKLLNSIQDYAELKGLLPDRQIIVLHHYAQRVWNKSHHNAIHLWGHSHGSLPPFGKSVDVGVDCKEITSDYRPVSLDEIVKYMAKRTGEVVDHHGMREE